MSQSSTKSSSSEDIETVLPEDGSVFTRGYINKQYTVWCGKCGNWSQVSARRQGRAEKLFRREGWSETNARGWMCKPCKDAQPPRA